MHWGSQGNLWIGLLLTIGVADVVGNLCFFCCGIFGVVVSVVLACGSWFCDGMGYGNWYAVALWVVVMMVRHGRGLSSPLRAGDCMACCDWSLVIDRFSASKNQEVYDDFYRKASADPVVVMVTVGVR